VVCPVIYWTSLSGSKKKEEKSGCVSISGEEKGDLGKGITDWKINLKMK